MTQSQQGLIPTLSFCAFILSEIKVEGKEMEPVMIQNACFFLLSPECADTEQIWNGRFSEED